MVGQISRRGKGKRTFGYNVAADYKKKVMCALCVYILSRPSKNQCIKARYNNWINNDGHPLVSMPTAVVHIIIGKVYSTNKVSREILKATLVRIRSRLDGFLRRGFLFREILLHLEDCESCQRSFVNNPKNESAIIREEPEEASSE